jgi:Ferric reductase like transmembrane component
VLAASTNTKAFWYLTRGTGVVSLVLLTLSVALGIAEVVRYASPGWPRFVLAALHKNASLLVTVFLGVHIVTAVADTFAPIRLLDAVIPFAGRYRPVWLGLGALAFDLLVALVVTSLLRERLGHRAWRLVHWTAYLCWPIAFLHGLGTGTDTRARWGLLLNLACLMAVLLAIWWRVGATRAVSAGRRVAAALASVTVAVAVVAWMLVEPMRPGWARKAGTPTGLLTAAASAPAAGTALRAPISSELQGTITETGSGFGNATVTVDATLSAVPAQLHVVIDGSALSDGGVTMRDSAVRLASTAGSTPDRYHGRVTSLDGDRLVAVVHDAAGRRMTLTVQLVTDGSNTVAGTLTARAGGSSNGG